MQKQKSAGIFLVILSAVIFGLNPLLAKTIYLGGSNSLTLTVHRMFISALPLYFLHKATTTESLAVTRKELVKLIICSVGYSATPVLLYSSYNYLSSGMATTIHFVYPVLVLVGCVVFCHAKVTPVKLICCALCMAGILCFYTPGGEVSLAGIAIAFASGATYAFYIVYLNESGLQEMSAYKLCFWKSILSAVELGVIAIAVDQMVWQMTTTGWVLTLVFSLVCGMTASMAFQVGAKYVGSQSASLLSTFEPVTSVIVGVIVYSEALTFRTVGGIVCILFSVILLTLKGED